MAQILDRESIELVRQVVRQVLSQSQGTRGGTGRQPRNAGPVIAYVAFTPVAGIPGRSGTTCGSAECSLYSIDEDFELQDTGETETIVNLAESDVAGEVFILCKREQGGGQLVCDWEECSS